MPSRTKNQSTRSKSVTKVKKDIKESIVNQSKKKGDEPTRARTSYNFFTIEVAKELEGKELGQGGLLKEVGKRWKKLKDSEKVPYEEMAEQEKKKFEKMGKGTKSKGKRSVSKPNTKKHKYVIDSDEEDKKP
jgi:hypothetical protein